MKKKALAVITARGGSKRIPGKNKKKFCGRPIIEYSIEAAIQSGVFDTVMVSTDDEEIAAIAQAAGAEVPFLRSADTAGDMAMTHEVLLEVLAQYEQLGITYEYLCCIYPTAPFLKPQVLKESFQLLQQEGTDGVVPIVAYSFPPQRCFVIKDCRIAYKWPENRLKRSQDLEVFYHDCGQFYLVKVDRFMEEKTMILAHTAPIIMDEMEVQDIDNYEDWRLAEAKYQMLHGNLGE